MTVPLCQWKRATDELSEPVRREDSACARGGWAPVHDLRGGLRWLRASAQRPLASRAEPPPLGYWRSEAGRCARHRGPRVSPCAGFVAGLVLGSITGTLEKLPGLLV